MNRVSLLLVASLVACGGSKPNQKNLAPLPPDKPVEEAKTEKPEAKPEVAQEPKPLTLPTLPPLEVKVDAPAATIKLVNAGKGKKAPLKYAAKQGAKQGVEMVLSYAQIATLGSQTQPMIVPTIVLKGDAETTTVDPSGKATYKLAMNATDARVDAGVDPAVPIDQFKQMIASLSSLVISGSVDAKGVMADTTMRVEKADKLSIGAIDIVKVMMPQWPVLPKEPVGVGAKWQATTSHSLMGAKDAKGIEMTQVTDYELVAKDATSWTIKAKTTVSGKDQDFNGGKISAIGGSGSSEVKVVDGSLYPTTVSQLETKLTRTEDKEAVQLVFKINGTLTPTN